MLQSSDDLSFGTEDHLGVLVAGGCNKLHGSGGGGYCYCGPRGRRVDVQESALIQTIVIFIARH